MQRGQNSLIHKCSGGGGGVVWSDGGWGGSGGGWAAEVAGSVGEVGRRTGAKENQPPIRNCDAPFHTT